MKSVPEVMARLPAKFQPQAAEALDAVFQIEIEDGQPYSIAVREGACTVTQENHPDPNVTLFMDSDTFVEIIYGDLGGTTAFLTGRLRAEGDLMLATRLSKLFKR